MSSSWSSSTSSPSSSCRRPRLGSGHVDDRARAGCQEVAAHRARRRRRWVGVVVGAQLGVDERAAPVGGVGTHFGEEDLGHRRRQGDVGVVVLVRARGRAGRLGGGGPALGGDGAGSATVGAGAPAVGDASGAGRATASVASSADGSASGTGSAPASDHPSPGCRAPTGTRRPRRSRRPRSVTSSTSPPATSTTARSTCASAVLDPRPRAGARQHRQRRLVGLDGDVAERHHAHAVVPGHAHVRGDVEPGGDRCRRQRLQLRAARARGERVDERLGSGALTKSRAEG